MKVDPRTTTLPALDGIHASASPRSRSRFGSGSHARYFKLAAENGIPYQTLINMPEGCEAHRKRSGQWRPSVPVRARGQ